MMNPAYAKQFNFQYQELVMARVTAVYTLEAERKLLIDATALDVRASWQKVPVSLSPGVARNYRVGQIVGLLFRGSASNYPTAIAHLHNLETNPAYTDPLPPPYEFVDDQVYYHPETKAFIRHRSATSTAIAGGGDAQPAVTEITLASGHTIVADETPGQQSVTVKSASGHVTKLDDVAKTITHTTAAGHKITMDDVAKTITHVTIGGHKIAMDDVAKTITHTTTGGHKVVLDDINKVITHVTIGGHKIVMDDVAQAITLQTPGATETAILDKVKGEIAHIAGAVGIGDRVANLPAETAALAQAHLTTFSNGVDAMRLVDMIAMGSHIAAAGIPNAGALVSILAGLAPLTKLSVPSGSGTVKLKL